MGLDEMDLFKPIVPQEAQHPNFKHLLLEPYVAVRAIIQDWSIGFEDRDGKLVKEFQTTFNSSFWELYLFSVFKELGLSIDFSESKPDFSLQTPYGSVSIEAVIASNADGSDREYEALKVIREGSQNSIEEMVYSASIRLANSLSYKAKKYHDSYSKLSHVIGKPFLVALAPFDQPCAQDQNLEPIINVLYGFTAKYVRNEEGEIVGVKRNKMTHLTKPNGSRIEVPLFKEKDFDSVGAVLFSNTATVGKVRALTDEDDPLCFFGAIRYNKYGYLPVVESKRKCDYKESLCDGLHVFHNPYSKVKVDKRLFSKRGIVQHEYLVESDEFVSNWEHGDLIQRMVMKGIPKSI